MLYEICSLAVSYLESKVLPSPVSALMISVTVLTGQVLAVRMLAASHSFALSSWDCLVADLGWRDCKEGTGEGEGEDFGILVVGGDYCGCGGVRIA